VHGDGILLAASSAKEQTMVAVAELDMAKKVGRPKGDRDDAPVRISKRLVGVAKLVAVHRGQTIAELLDEMLEGPLDRAYAAMLRDLEKKDGGQ
jgi:hypothetical protein